MNRRIRGSQESMVPTVPFYGSAKDALPLWDLTGGASKNNPVQKLGYGEGARGVAHILTDAQQRSQQADGVLNSPGYNTRRPLNPDCWALRSHVKGGRGRDVTWDVRLTVDDVNHNAERKCRGTMVISQDDSQCWAWLSDLAKVRDLQTEIKHDELQFNGAGFLTGLGTARRGGFRQDTPTGKKVRAALMQNHAMNAGFFTDGERAASLWHIFFAMPVEAGGGNAEMQTPDGGNQTQAATGHGKGCKEPAKWMGALRGDVNFDMEGTPVHLAVESAYLTGGDQYAGNHWISGPAPKLPRFEPMKDKQSNHEVLPRKLRRGLWTWVRVHRNDCPPPPEVGPLLDADGFATYGTSGAGPDASAGGSGDAGDWRPPELLWDNGGCRLVFPQSYITYDHFTLPIPEYGSEIDYRIKVPYTLPTNLSGGDTMKFRLFYKIVTTSGKVIGTTWTEVTKQITTANNPTGANQVRWLVFTIRRVGLQASLSMGGGSIYCWFMRRSDDSVAKDFYMLSNVRGAWKPTQAGDPAFAGVA